MQHIFGMDLTCKNFELSDYFLSVAHEDSKNIPPISYSGNIKYTLIRNLLCFTFINTCHLL